jgi:cytochrome c553
MPTLHNRTILALLALVLSTVPVTAQDSSAALTFFETRIRPLLAERCYSCHGAETAEAGLRLDVRSGWERGGQRGPAIVPGDPSASLLMRIVQGNIDGLEMPPADSGGRLSDHQLQDLARWIREGAVDPRSGERVVTPIETAARNHWAFQPLAPPDVPADQHPIDFLVQRRLAAAGMTAVEPAETAVLIRRAAMDLTGLPPSPQQLALSRDQFPDLIRSLLNSPRYAERWARHWLDVARYSDARDGVLMYGDARIRPFAWTYRDYVIRAFEQDKPFDRFILEQLAADQLQLPPDSPDLAALGLLTLGRMFDRNRHDVIDDQIDVVGRGFLGLTIACARCHDHKFDPIPTADYYSLYGIFASSTEPLDRPRIAPTTAAGQAFETEFSAKLKEVLDQRAQHYEATLNTARERTPDYLAHIVTTPPDVAETAIFFLSPVPGQLRPQITHRWRQAIAARAFPDDPLFGPWADLMREPMLRPDEWKSRGADPRIIAALLAANPATPVDVARVYGTVLRDIWKSGAGETDPAAALLIARSGPVWFPIEDTANYLDRTPGDAFRGLVGQLDAIAVRHPEAAARAMVLVDSDVLVDPVIFQRGDPVLRGSPVPRRFLAQLSPAERQPFTRGSGRLELAQAIASPANPITARVWVNRVWMHHFGEPLVDAPGDFGLQTKQPLQADLLDYLADFLIRSGWHTKPLHELILTSQTWQRSSLVPNTPQMQAQAAADPTNAYLWRAHRRRLDLEQMRDTLLSISGELDLTMYGRPKVITDDTNLRRTIYAFVERQNIPPLVQNFDFANADTSTPRRSQTTVPQQALFALNSSFMLQRSKALAAAAQATTTDPQSLVKNLFERTLGRSPNDDEAASCKDYLAGNSPELLAQVLLMSNELMFVD